MLDDIFHVLGGRISLVLLQIVFRIQFVIVMHQPISGDLGQDGCCGDGSKLHGW